MAGNVPNAAETNIRKIVQGVRELFQGRSNAVGTLTLEDGAASTTVTAINCGQDSKVFLTPTTANAAAEVGAGTLYVSSVASGAFTLTHANNAQTDRTFVYVCLG